MNEAGYDTFKEVPVPQKRALVYISGPISSLKYEVAKSRFARGAEIARSMGLSVMNPMTFGEGQPGKEWHEYMREDLSGLVKCDGIMLLDGWRGSKGARIEKFIAEQLGLAILGPDCLPLRKENIIEEAGRIVEDRQKTYGHPKADFERIAGLWNLILTPGEEITARQVAHMMICVKLSREVTSHKRDNLLDIAGYAHAGYMAEPDEYEEPD